MASIPAFRNSVERPEAGADAAGADESPPDPGKVSTIWLPLKLSEPPVTRASPFTSTQFVPWTCITLAWPCWPATTSEVTCWAARVSANAGSSTIVATFHRVVRLPFLCISLLLLRGTTAWRYPAPVPLETALGMIAESGGERCGGEQAGRAEARAVPRRSLPRHLGRLGTDRR